MRYYISDLHFGHAKLNTDMDRRGFCNTFDEILVNEFIQRTRDCRCEVRGSDEQQKIPCQMINCFCMFSDDFERFAIMVQTHCFAVKMELLWDSSDNFYYLDHERVLKYLPNIDDFRYVPVSNQILAKAEIPFLIFEKNKGRCYIEKD